MTLTAAVKSTFRRVDSSAGVRLSADMDCPPRMGSVGGGRDAERTSCESAPAKRGSDEGSAKPLTERVTGRLSRPALMTALRADTFPPSVPVKVTFVQRDAPSDTFLAVTVPMRPPSKNTAAPMSPSGFMAMGAGFNTETLSSTLTAVAFEPTRLRSEGGVEQRTGGTGKR